MPPLSLNGLLNQRLPINDLERLWLEASCFYAVFDENILEDTEWDHLGRELWERRLKLSPYFAHALGLSWPVEPREDNPLVSAMGINWERDLPAIVVEGIRKDGPKRVAHWKARLEELRGWVRRRNVGDRLIEEGRAEAARRRALRKKALTGTSLPSTPSN